MPFEKGRRIESLFTGRTPVWPDTYILETKDVSDKHAGHDSRMRTHEIGSARTSIKFFESRCERSGVRSADPVVLLRLVLLFDTVQSSSVSDIVS